MMLMEDYLINTKLTETTPVESLIAHQLGLAGFVGRSSRGARYSHWAVRLAWSGLGCQQNSSGK